MILIFYGLLFILILYGVLNAARVKGVRLLRFEYTSSLIYLERGNKLNWFYEIGTILVLASILVAQCILAYATILSFKALIILFNESQAIIVGKEPGVPRRMMKRALEVISTKGPTAATSTLLLRPIIPTTLFPIVLLALITSQIFHELGHAKAASLSSAVSLQFGLYLNFIFPSFFVKLPTPTHRNYLAELRIAAAGVYHSLLLVFIAYTLSKSGLGISNSISTTLLSNPFNQGVQIISIADYSPLLNLIQKGEIITHLNDLELDNLDSNHQLWSSYLNNRVSKSQAQYHNMGWCLPRQSFDGSSIVKPCCVFEEFQKPPKDHNLCFSILPDQNHYTKQRACINPLEEENSLFLPNQNEDSLESIPKRCINNGNCQHGYGCARPDRGEAVLRMKVLSLRDQEERIIVFQGSRKNVFEQIIVSDRSPRFWFVPIGFEGYLELFWQHVQSISLAIAFFNLLPLRFLDGSEIIKSLLLHLTITSQSIDPPLPTSFFASWKSHGLLVTLLAKFVLPSNQNQNSSPQPTPSASPSLATDYWEKKSKSVSGGGKKISNEEREKLWWKSFKFLRIWTMGCLGVLAIFSLVVEILCFGRVEVGVVLG